MPYADADGVRLYYEEAGDGNPLVFVHEFAGDHRSWEAQLRFFARRYRCVAYNARGYPPSDVPDDPADYGQARQADDVAAVLDHLGVDRAHVVGLSMGGFATLHFGLRHPDRARSLVVAGAGSGAPKGAAREAFIRDSLAAADGFETAGSAAMAGTMAAGPTRVQLRAKDPRGWAEFKAHLAGHSAAGSANTLRGYQAARPSLYDLEAEIRAVTVPTLVVVGDEDEPCLDASLWLKRIMPWAGLWVVPRTGHCVNLEEPAAFNARVLDFLTQVEQGRWAPRPAATAGASFGAVGEA
jgi:pimeloyl-ACP methyl ester carboxylesterase